MATDHELVDLFPSSAVSFFDPPASLSKDCMSILSKLFESTVASRSSSCPKPPLSQLYSGDGFGPDEVWAELELVNEPLIRHLQQQVSSLAKLRDIRLLQQQNEEDNDQLNPSDHQAASEEEQDQDIDDINPDDDDDQYIDQDQDIDIDQDQEDQDIDQDQDIDDRFFNLESMEEFVNNADTVAASGEEYDMFRESDINTEKQLHYGDFFDPPPPSAHQRREDRMKGHIARLEATNLADKSWQMSGEASARARPENSLLEEDLMFEAASRPAPEITEQDTRTMEDMIRQRIIDKAWDDVERRVKPPERPYNYALSRPLDQEKSKLSLAEVYEQEYLKQQEDNERDELDTPQHLEIKQLMTSLFSKLDALSNYHFTPKLPEPEIKTVSNVPSLSLEEVTPVGHNEIMTLAPQEIQTPSADITGPSERTLTDKKRERRTKKRLQHMKMLRARSKLTKQQDDQKPLRSSSSGQFFSQLQQQVVGKLHQSTTTVNSKRSNRHLKL